MTTSRFDILGIGNAMADVLASVDDTFLAKHDMHKGRMALIDQLDVPLAMSPLSNKRTFSLRIAASRAMPAPLMPAPMIIRSKVWFSMLA